MADEVVKLIFELENKATKDVEKFKKDLNKLKKSSEQAGKGIGKFNNQTSKTGKGLKGLNTNVNKIGGGLKSAAGAFAAVAAAMGAVVAQTVALNKELAKQANFAGVSIEEFQKLAFAAEQYGSSADEIADTLNEIALKSQEAATLGSGAFVDAAKLLGISAQEFAKQDPAEQFFLLSDALGKADDGLKRLLEDELGSDAFRNLRKLTDAGREGFEALAQELENSGGLISELDNQRVAEIGKAFNGLSKTFNAVLTKNVANFSEEIVGAIKKTQELINKFSTGNFARPISSSFNVIGKALKSVGQIILGLISSIGDVIDLGLNNIKATFSEFALSIDKTLKDNFKISFLSDEAKSELETDLKDANSETKQAGENISNNFKPVGETVKSIGQEIVLFGKLTADQSSLVKAALDGQIKDQEKLKEAIQLAGLAFGENSEQVQQLTFNLNQSVVEAKKLNEEAAKLNNLSISLKLEEQFKKASIELLKITGDVAGVVNLQAKFENQQLQAEVDALFSSLNQELLKTGTDFSINPNIKIGSEEFEQALKVTQEAIAESAGTDNAEFIANTDAIIEKLRVISQYQELLKSQTGIAVLTQDIEQLQLQLQLGEATPDQVLAAMVEKLNAMAQVLPANSAELLAFRLEVEKMQEDLDVLGAITDKFAEDFASGMAKAFTDSLSGGEDFVSGMKNLLRDLALSFIEATIRALILTAIMRGINGGGTTTFSQDFTKNLGGSFGIDVGKFHNGTGSGTVGDDNGLRNGTKNINLLNPAGSLNSNEIFAVLKKDEAVVQRSSLNSPTGVGNQQVQQDINVTNVVGEDNMGALLETPNNRDRIINIINSERDRILL